MSTILVSCDWDKQAKRKFRDYIIDRKLNIYHGEPEWISENIDDEEETKDHFVEYGEDSLLILQGLDVICLYIYDLDKYKKKYHSFHKFKEAFLTQQTHREKLLEMSVHKRIDKRILEEYEQMPFDKFMNKYCYENYGDTLLRRRNATVAYCLDKQHYYCRGLTDIYDFPVVFRRLRVK